VPVPLVLLLFGLARPTASTFAAGLGLALLGETLRVWSAMHIGPQSRTRGMGVGQLAVGGPYRSCRNPLYVANLMLYTAVALLSGRPLAVAFPCTMAVVYALVVRFEETCLSTVHARAYEDYRRVVPRWVGLRPRLSASAPKVDLRGAWRAERGTLLVVVLVVSAFVARATVAVGSSARLPGLP
jgi:protein-S-isoprenylcysteine O-methyltransferase Ste14